MLLCAWGATVWQGYGQEASDTLKLYFELGQPGLTKKAASAIDSWVYSDRITAAREILIIGYADHLGGTEYNEQLSEQRAANVQDYLLGLGITKSNIRMLVGRGEVARATEKTDGYPTDRRVDIVLPGKQGKQKPAGAPPPPQTMPPTKIEVAKPGETFVLENIYFYVGRHVVKEQSIPELDKLYNALASNPKVKIQIEGHVCCVAKNRDALDEDTFEMALSVNRAKYIYQYLIKRGIASERLHYRGFGKSRPVVEKEKTEADEDKNRRVEIRVLAN